MAERRRRIWRWVLVRVLLLAIGFAAGFYVRDRHYDELQTRYERAESALEDARDEIDRLRETGAEAVDRTRRAAEELQRAKEAIEDTSGN